MTTLIGGCIDDHAIFRSPFLAMVKSRWAVICTLTLFHVSEASMVKIRWIGGSNTHRASSITGESLGRTWDAFRTPPDHTMSSEPVVERMACDSILQLYYSVQWHWIS
jgi:hypothetical protein